mgnify:FL=1
MDYTTKLAYQSNYWYNDGLNKANIRDLTGAITSLKKSLQYNRDNIASRNLLGLVYYGRGDVVEALAEWVLSKNLQPKENIANYYIQKVKEKRDDLDRINQAIKRYNQALDYCYQRCEDLAVMQLKKAIEMHPTYVKAYQLLALLYIMEEQYAEARKNIRIAHKLDKTDDITMRYMHELNQVRKSRNIRLIDDKDTGKKKKGRQTVTYNIGNETIIQPVASGLKDNVGLHTMVNIAIGVIVGVAVMGFLIMPAVSASRQSKLNKQTVKFSDQIATQKSQISALKKELDKLQKNLGGIKDMKRIPDAIFIVDPKKERICVQEAHTLGIPLIGIADTNCDPEELDYVIPGNDDAIRAVKLIVAKMADAVIEANQGEAQADFAEAEETTEA